MALSCYLDDSNDSLSSVLTIGGYVGLDSQWPAFEAGAEEVLERYGIGTLHAKQFHHSQEDFKGWRLPKKLQFIDDLYAHVSRNGIFGIFVSISKRDLGLIKGKHRKLSSASGLSVCFSALCNYLLRSPETGQMLETHGLEIFVESGNKNNASVASLYHDLATNDQFEGLLRSFALIGKNSCRAIQLADFLVFHARRWSSLKHQADPHLLIAATPVTARLSARAMHFDLIVTADGDDMVMRRLTAPSVQSKWVIREIQ